MAVSIVGMGRSGTSMVARILNLSGLYLGDPHDMMPGHESNPQGHWEHLAICELNDQLLSLFGGDWHHPPHMPSGWLDVPAVQRLEHRARDLIATTFGGGYNWGWKDPRTAPLLPFWRRVVPDLRYIICVRNPLDVAKSLSVRDGTSAEHAFALWYFYVRTALEQTTSELRMVVLYEQFFDDLPGTVNPLLAFAGLSNGEDTGPLLLRLGGSVNPTLWHHRHSPHDALNSRDVPSGVKRLYRSIIENPGTPFDE